MKEKILADLLSVLVDGCGYENVLKALTAIKPQKKPVKKDKKPAVAKKKLARPKPNAITAIESIEFTDSDKRDYLLALAKKYDKKLFMPNVGHVRMFLEDKNIIFEPHNSRIKSRQQATVKVFKKLAEMSLEELREIEYCGLYDPPKRLATYAEAIENFGRSVRGSR